MSDGVPVCVDLSHWQAGADLAVMKQAGVAAVILKCTEGTTLLDESFADFQSQAAMNAIPWATYHYLHPGNAAEQMDWYLSQAVPDPGARVIIDFEDIGCTLDDLEEAVIRIGTIDPTLQITVYGGHLIKQALGDSYNQLLAERTSLWIAQYTDADAPDWPQATWPLWSLWQYTDSAPVPGASSPIDGNRFNGSTENLIAWIGPARPEPPRPYQPMVGILLTATTPVTINVQAGENVTIG